MMELKYLFNFKQKKIRFFKNGISLNENRLKLIENKAHRISAHQKINVHSCSRYNNLKHNYGTLILPLRLNCWFFFPFKSLHGFIVVTKKV